MVERPSQVLYHGSGLEKIRKWSDKKNGNRNKLGDRGPQGERAGKKKVLESSRNEKLCSEVWLVAFHISEEKHFWAMIRSKTEERKRGKVEVSEAKGFRELR